MLIEPLYFCATAFPLIIFTKVVEIFHHGVIDGRGVGKVEYDRLALRNGHQVALQNEIVGEKRRAAHLDVEDAGLRLDDIAAKP